MKAQTWGDAGLEHASDAEGRNRTSVTGGAISPGMEAPMTLLSEVDEDVEIPTASHKHASSNPLSSEGLKSQKMDDDPTPRPKVKAAKTESSNIHQITEVELCHNDEEMLDTGLEEFDLPYMDEDE